MTYLHNILAALVKDGMDLDVTENVILGGAPGQTISLRCAIANAHKRLWAHIACALLTFVQWRHCRDQIDHIPMSAGNYVRAVIALIGVPAALFMGASYAVHFIWTIL